MSAEKSMTSKSELIRAIRKPGKVYVTMLVRDDVIRVAVEKTDLLDKLQDEPEENCSVMGFYQDGVLIVDANPQTVS